MHPAGCNAGRSLIDASRTCMDDCRQGRPRRHQLRDIVVHQQTHRSAVLEDFVLYPEDEAVVVEKYSTVKEVRGLKRAAGDKLHALERAVKQKAPRERGLEPETPPNDRTESAMTQCKEAAKSNKRPVEEHQKPTIERLPSPEFSDDEILDFWSCSLSPQTSMTEVSAKSEAEPNT